MHSTLALQGCPQAQDRPRRQRMLACASRMQSRSCSCSCGQCYAVHGWRFRAPTRASYESAAPITARRLLPRVLGWHEHLQQARRHGAATAVHSRVYTDDIHCELHIAQLVRQRAAHSAQIALTLKLVCRPCVLAPPNSCANPKKQRRTLERQPPLGAPLRRAGGRCTLALVEMPCAGL